MEPLDNKNLFAVAGDDSGLSKNGKVWSTLGYLKSHITGRHDCHKYNDDYEVIEYEMVEVKRYKVSELNKNK